MIYMGMPPKHVTCDICMPFIRASTVNSTMTEWTVLQGTSKNHSPGTLTSGYKLKATKLPARSCDAHADLESLNMLKATRINSRTISITFFLKQRMRSIEYVDKQDRDQKYYVSTTWLIKDNMCTLAHMPMISKAHTFGKDVVVALGEGHSRVAECTRLVPEGGYPGKCKLFFRSTLGARTQEHTAI